MPDVQRIKFYESNAENSSAEFSTVKMKKILSSRSSIYSPGLPREASLELMLFLYT